MTSPTHARSDPPHPFRVLVADDSPDTADTLAVLLELIGYAVAVAYDGEAVGPLAERFRPYACILDVRMPKVDGWEAARRLRAGPGGGRLLLVAVTGVQGRAAARQSAAAGFDYHLVKPADPLDILARVAAGRPRAAARPLAVVGALSPPGA